MAPFAEPAVHRDRFPITASLLILVACIASYLTLSAGLPGTFLLDDIGRIQNVDLASLTADEIGTAIGSADSGLFGRPLSLASLYVTKAIHGNDPGAFRHENILLHLVVALLVFWLVGRLLQSRQLGLASRLEPATLWALSAALAAVWALHPLHVSTVLYAVQRMTLLSTLFVLLALLAYVIARQQPRFTPRVAIATVAVVGLFTLLGVLSKEPAVLVPCFLLLIEAVIFRFAAADRTERRTLTGVQLLLVALPLLLGAGYVLYRLDWVLHDYVMRDFTLWERLATQTVVLWRYVGILLLPRLSEMTLYHDTTATLDFTDPLVLVATLAWLAALTGAVAFSRRMPLASFGLLFFLIGHALESSFLPLELVFEHRNYLPSLGIMLLLLAVPLNLPLMRQTAGYAGLFFLLLTLMFGFMQWTRAYTWRNSMAFHLIVLQEHPGSIRGASEFANHALRTGQPGLARQVLRRALELNEGNRTSGLRVHLISTHCLGKQVPDDLLAETIESLAEEPLGPYAVSGLDALNERSSDGNCPGVSPQQVVQLLESAAGNERTRRSFAFIVNTAAGTALLESGDPGRAHGYLVRALRHESEAPPQLRLRAVLRLAQACKRLEDLTCYERAIARARELIETSRFTRPADRELYHAITDDPLRDRQR